MENKTQDKYTSLELSKLLKEAGCEIESEKVYHVPGNDGILRQCPTIKAYDIMWDICIVHAKEFFGTHKICYECGGINIKKDNSCEEGGYYCVDCNAGETTIEAYDYHTQHILTQLQNGAKEKVELYIIENSIFFKNQKEK